MLTIPLLQMPTLPTSFFETPRRSDSKKLPVEEVVTEVNPQALILRLIEGYSPSADTISALNTLFAFWGVTEWQELKVLSRSDVNEYFKSNHVNTKLLIKKKIGFIVEYARHNVLLETTQMRDIVSVVDGVGKADDSTASTATTTTSDSSGQKKTVPQLEKFTGLYEDY